MRTKTCALPSVLALKVKDQRSRSDTPTFIRLIELIETANYHVNLHEILTSSFQVTDSLLIHKYENSFQGQTSRSHVTKTLKKLLQFHVTDIPTKLYQFLIRRFTARQLAMLTAVIATVCLSARPSVTFRCLVQTMKIRSRGFQHQIGQSF